VVARLPPSDALDNVFVGGGFNNHSVLQKSVEELASALRGAPVESKRKRIEVAVQMLWTHCTLMRTKDPSLQERRYAMHAGQEVACRSFRPIENRDLGSMGTFVQKVLCSWEYLALCYAAYIRL